MEGKVQYANVTITYMLHSVHPSLARQGYARAMRVGQVWCAGVVRVRVVSLRCGARARVVRIGRVYLRCGARGWCEGDGSSCSGVVREGGADGTGLARVRCAVAVRRPFPPTPRPLPTAVPLCPALSLFRLRKLVVWTPTAASLDPKRPAAECCLAPANGKPLWEDYSSMSPFKCQVR